MSERDEVRKRERESSARGLNGRGSVSTPDILSREAVHAIRIAATPVWRVDINVAARITNSINGRGKATGDCDDWIEIVQPARDTSLTERERCRTTAYRSGEMSSPFSYRRHIGSGLANSMIVGDNPV